jgi:hypothetical protein
MTSDSPSSSDAPIKGLIDLLVDVLDEQGYETGRAVPVRVLYHVEYIIDQVVCLDDASLTDSERRQVASDAEAIFRRRMQGRSERRIYATRHQAGVDYTATQWHSADQGRARQR